MINKTIKMLLRRTLALAATLVFTNMPLAEEPISGPELACYLSEHGYEYPTNFWTGTP